MDEIEHFPLFPRGREAQLVSVGLKETGDVQVPEAIRQVCNFETFPDLFPINLFSVLGTNPCAVSLKHG